MQSGEEIWSALRDSLRGNASEAVWAAGLNTLRLVDYHDNELVIGAPNQIQLLRVQQRYLPFITEQAQQLLVGHVQVSLTVTESTSRQSSTTVAMTPMSPKWHRDRHLRAERRSAGSTRPAHDLRLLRAGIVEPPRLRRRAVGRRNPWSCLQSAHDLRELRARQDPPPPRHWQLRAGELSRSQGPLRLDRNIPERLHSRDPNPHPTRAARALPRERRAC